MSKQRKKIRVTVEKTLTGFSAYAIDLPVFTTGRTMPALQKNMSEALSLYYENGTEVKSDSISFKI